MPSPVHVRYERVQSHSRRRHLDSDAFGPRRGYATHIQRDEIDNTKNPERRASLAQVFGDVVAELPPTDSFVLGVSRLDEARLGGERVVPTASAVYGVSRYEQAKYSAEDNLFSALKDRLDGINRNKPNNVHDANC